MSIENQTYKNFEVWIIDADSTDGTNLYLKTLKAPFNWISKPDSGIYDAMNKGITLSKGEWLLFLGCDDKIYCKETLKNIFSKKIDHNTKLILGKIKYNYNENDSNFIKKNDGVITASWSKYLWIKNTLPHQGIFYGKSVFDNNSYSLDYAVLADYALNLNLYNAKVKIKSIDHIISICGTKGISKNYNWKLYKEEINLKTQESSVIFKPIFIFISSIKYVVKSLKI